MRNEIGIMVRKIMMSIAITTAKISLNEGKNQLYIIPLLNEKSNPDRFWKQLAECTKKN